MTEQALDPGVDRPPLPTRSGLLSRRRTATRARLVESAVQLFAERGTFNLTVEAICERAGFTRGAFYSNFTSVDDVFLTGYIERSEALGAMLEATIGEIAARPLGLDAMRDAAALVLAALPEEGSWSAVRAGLLSRIPQDARTTEALRGQAERFRAGLERVLVPALTRLRRAPLTDSATLARALIAADAGLQMQSALHEHPDEIRTAAITGLLTGLTTSIDGAAAPPRPDED